MQEKKSSSTSTEMANKNPKKANLLDHHSIKHILDESVSEIVTSRGYVEDVRMSNVRLAVLGPASLVCIFGILLVHANCVSVLHKVQFSIGIPVYECPGICFGCFSLLLQLPRCENSFSSRVALDWLDELMGSFTSTGLVVSSKLPRFSDLYTLTVASADPKSISAGQPVEFTKSVTQWFAKDGVLVEGLFWKDVLALLDEYAIEPKKKK
ncbi:putative signal peptidase complex subunit 2 [Citrus sinensis]|nr:putative signal peptidase complex subunit 2 [Citrus sinensis]